MIEEIIQKPKRKYVRKPKVVVPEVTQPGLVREGLVVPEVVVPEVVVPEVVVPEIIPVPDVTQPGLVREGLVVPESIASDKKPRSQKQLDAFNRMREARLKKSAELQELKAFEKEKQLFEKEQLKVEKMEKKIVSGMSQRTNVRKVTKTTPQPKSPPPPPPTHQLPQSGRSSGQPTPQSIHQPIPQVSTVRPILFV